MEAWPRRRQWKASSSTPEIEREGEQHVTFTERIKHFTWAWFAFPLSTSSLSIQLATTPHRFAGLTTIGKIFFIFALVVTVASIAAIATRFILKPEAVMLSLTHPNEALFFPMSLLNFSNLLSCSQIYGAPTCGPWLLHALRILFWIYVSISFITAVVQYFDLFTAPATRLTIQGMTPAWILPIYPCILIGTLASILAPGQTPDHRMPILIAGLTFTGLGWLIALLMYAVYIQRMIAYGLPAPNLRPGMFISVGPATYTAVALIGISDAIPSDYGYFASRPYAIGVLETLTDFIAIFLWGLGFWFFCVTLVAVLGGVRKMSFHLVWWSFVFPNVGFANCTTKIGERLESQGILWVASAMTIVLVGLWIFVFVALVRAVVRRDILMPGKDEDKDEFKNDDEKFGVRAPP